MTIEGVRLMILTTVTVLVSFSAGFYVHRRFNGLIEGWLAKVKFW
jgi:hypothetical protein